MSRKFTAVLVKLNTKHPIPAEVEWSVLKTLQHVFTTTTNEFKSNVTNIKFEAELEEILRNDEQYQNRSTLERFLYLCEGLIVQWERLHYDSGLTGNEGEGNKKARGESTGYKSLLISSMRELLERNSMFCTHHLYQTCKNLEHCEGCGIPRHKRESCNLKEHPDFNREGKSSSYKKKKTLIVSKGIREEQTCFSGANM